MIRLIEWTHSNTMVVTRKQNVEMALTYEDSVKAGATFSQIPDETPSRAPPTVPASPTMAPMASSMRSIRVGPGSGGGTEVVVVVRGGSVVFVVVGDATPDDFIDASGDAVAAELEPTLALAKFLSCLAMLPSLVMVGSDSCMSPGAVGRRAVPALNPWEVELCSGDLRGKLEKDASAAWYPLIALVGLPAAAVRLALAGGCLSVVMDVGVCG